MGQTRYVPAPEFERAYLRSTHARDLLKDLVDEGVQLAEQSAPRRLGYLEEGIEGEVDLDGADGGYVGRVVSHDFKSLWVEFGTIHTRAQPFLVPTLTALVPGAPIARQ